MVDKRIFIISILVLIALSTSVYAQGEEEFNTDFQNEIKAAATNDNGDALSEVQNSNLRLSEDFNFKINAETKYLFIKKYNEVRDTGNVDFLIVMPRKLELSKKEILELSPAQQKEVATIITKAGTSTNQLISIILIIIGVLGIPALLLSRHIIRKNVAKGLIKAETITKFGKEEENILLAIYSIESYKAKLVQQNTELSEKLEEEVETIKALNTKLHETYAGNIKNIEIGKNVLKKPLTLSMVMGLKEFGLTEREIDILKLVFRRNNPFTVTYTIALILGKIKEQNKELMKLAKKEIKLDENLVKDLEITASKLKTGSETLQSFESTRKELRNNPKIHEGVDPNHIKKIQEMTFKELKSTEDKELQTTYQIIKKFHEIRSALEQFKETIKNQDEIIKEEKEKIELLKEEKNG